MSIPAGAGVVEEPGGVVAAFAAAVEARFDVTLFNCATLSLYVVRDALLVTSNGEDAGAAPPLLGNAVTGAAPGIPGAVGAVAGILFTHYDGEVI